MFKKKFIYTSYIPYFVIIFSSIIYFARLFYPQNMLFATPDFGQSDILDLHIPMKYLLYQSLSHNTLPLWTKTLGNGFPLLAALEIGALNPVNVILFKLLPFISAFNAIYIVSFLINALGTYLFSKKIKLTTKTSLYVSIIYAFSGYFIVQIPHTDILQTIVLLPWFFYFTFNVFCDSNKLNSVLLLSVVIALSIFASYPQITFICLLGSLFFAFYLWTRHLKNKPIFPLLLYLGSIILGFIFGAAQLIPAFEFLQLSGRSFGLPLNTATYYSFPIEHLLGFLYPFALGNPTLGTYPPFSSFNGSIFWENTGYVGLIPVFLVLLSLSIINKKKYIMFFLVLLVLSLLLMLGQYSPIKLIYILPVFSLFRVPSRFILLFVWSIMIVTGCTMDYILAGFTSKYSKYISLILYSLIFILSILDVQRFFYTYNPLLPAAQVLNKPPAASVIDPSAGRIITLGDDIYWNVVFNKGWVNPQKILYFNNFFRQNINVLYGINQSQVYQGNTLTENNNINDLVDQNIFLSKNMHILLNSVSEKIMRMEHIRYILSPYPLLFSGVVEKALPITKGMPDVYISILPASKQVYIVHAKELMNTIQALTQLDNASFNPWTTVLLDQDDGHSLDNIKTSTSDNVSILKSTDREMVIKAQTSEPGYLVIANTYYPGWMATVNNMNEQVLQANTFQDAVYIPKGDSSISIYYYPGSFMTGFYVSLITFMLSIVTLLLIKKKLIFSKTKVWITDQWVYLSEV